MIKGILVVLMVLVISGIGYAEDFSGGGNSFFLQLLFLAYSLAWVLIIFYVGTLYNRQKRLEDELRFLMKQYQED